MLIDSILWQGVNFRHFTSTADYFFLPYVDSYVLFHTTLLELTFLDFLRSSEARLMCLKAFEG